MRRKKALSIIANDRSTRMIDPKSKPKGAHLRQPVHGLLSSVRSPTFSPKIAKNNLID
jgi:hypothetical protein